MVRRDGTEVRYDPGMAAGPWEGAGRSSRAWIRASRVVCARVRRHDSAEANAHLIAAAPISTPLLSR